MEIEGLELKYHEVPSGYARCFCDSCPRAAECLRHAVGSLAPARAAVGPCVFPQSATVPCGCPYFRPMRTQRMAWGFRYLFRDVLARDSATLRAKVMAYLGRAAPTTAATAASASSRRASSRTSSPSSPPAAMTPPPSPSTTTPPA